MKKILVVDDEKPLRESIRAILEGEDYEIFEASDGKEAIDLVEERRPDLVIMDIIMPEKEGIETIFELYGKYPDIRVIAMSGGGRLEAEEFLAVARGLKVIATLKKPFKAEKLIELVRDSLKSE